jgi:hypothetical protein
MIERVEERFALKPKHIAGDVAYGTGEMLGWLVDHDIDPHIPVWDRDRRDGIFNRSDFRYDQARDLYVCPAGKELASSGRLQSYGYYRYTARNCDCQHCALKMRCCPKQPERRVPRTPDEAAREYTRNLMNTEGYRHSRTERKKIERLFGEVKRYLGLTRLRLRGLTSARDEFLLVGHCAEPEETGQARRDSATSMPRGRLISSRHPNCKGNRVEQLQNTGPSRISTLPRPNSRLLQQSQPKPDIRSSFS